MCVHLTLFFLSLSLSFFLHTLLNINPTKIQNFYARSHSTIQISADIESTLEIITEMLKYFEEVRTRMMLYAIELC